MLRRMRPDEVKSIGSSFGLDVVSNDAVAFTELAHDLMLTLDELGFGPQVPQALECVRQDHGRVSRDDDPFNAIVRRCKVLACGDGVLGGKRIAIKDTIGVAGIPLTAGSRILQDFVPRRDSVVVQRMLAAGAEIVAMTNTDYLALSGGGDSSFYGPMLNPFDRTRTTGGSSGGSGASLYYDWVDITLGCDQGGSIRVPASWCGVIGHKPTFSLVPFTGIVGLDPSIDHVGPMGRTTEDVAALLGVIAGKDASDPRQYDVTTEDYLARVRQAPDSLKGITVGVLREGTDPALGIDPLVESGFRSTIDQFVNMGARVVDISVPMHLRAGAIGFATFLEGMVATVTSGGSGYGTKGSYWPELASAFRMGLASHADQLSPQSKMIFILGRYLQTRYGGSIYAQAQTMRPALTAAYDIALEQCDVIVLPTTPGLPHKIEPDLSISEFVQRGWAVLGNTSPGDLTGHPSISLPTTGVNNLPIGVMAMSKHFNDGLLLQIASTYEQSKGWFTGKLDLPAPSAPQRGM